MFADILLQILAAHGQILTDTRKLDRLSGSKGKMEENGKSTNLTRGWVIPCKEGGRLLLRVNKGRVGVGQGKSVSPLYMIGAESNSSAASSYHQH